MPSELAVGSTCPDRTHPWRTPELGKSGQMNTPHGGNGTVLLRAEDQVGHGARAVSRTAELAGDTLAFAARHTGLKV